MAWSFSRLTIISFNLNHSIAAWLSVSSVERRFSIVLSAAVIVLSSAKFNRSVFVIQRYRSFINMLHRSGPSIEAWRTPDKSTWNTLWVLLNFTFCFRLFIPSKNHFPSSLEVSISPKRCKLIPFYFERMIWEASIKFCFVNTFCPNKNV